MKNEYDDIDSLLKDLESDIEDTLMDEVLDKVRDIEMSHIQSKVLRAYSPKIYQRRSSDGIDDPNNIVGTVSNGELEVENVTRFNSGYGTWNRGTGLAELINDGNRTNGYYYDFPGVFNQPRPFLDRTAEDVENTNIIENTLGKGLKRRKWDVE